ncbi:ABC transporter ATP-binding protein [Aerococcaceae bacterium NML180378]|nr:ABC transporter ATP-binding protein [Aerococcaceae bacterium NML180378]
MIHCEQLSFRYANRSQTLCKIEQLTIRAGECIVLCGESGSGKSTFLRLLNGLIPDFYAGEVVGECHCAGYDVVPTSVETLSTVVGSVFQNPATQFFHRRVEDELVFPCENQGLPRDIIACHLKETVAFFQIEDLLERDLLTASGGERQRIAIATALMQQPKVMVLDEPTANLDEQGIQQVAEQIARLKAAGVTVIVAEHRLNFLTELADRYLFFAKGELVHQWTSSQYRALSEEERHVLGLRSAAVSLTCQPLGNSGVGLTLSEVSVGYRTKQLAHIERVVFPTEQVIGIIGANGSGKTTLAKQLAGLQELSGYVTWFGKNFPAQERLRQTAFVMQEVRLQLHAESVRKEILLGASRLQDFDQVVAQLNLTNLLDCHPMALSGGQQQRVMIANALLSDKKVFIFDEPTSGLDYKQMRHVAKLLQQLKRSDRVVLVITHDEEFLNLACDSVWEMK